MKKICGIPINLSHITLLNQSKSADFLPAEQRDTFGVKQLVRHYSKNKVREIDKALN